MRVEKYGVLDEMHIASRVALYFVNKTSNYDSPQYDSRSNKFILNSEILVNYKEVKEKFFSL
jgi:hypothetical protein